MWGLALQPSSSSRIPPPLCSCHGVLPHVILGSIRIILRHLRVVMIGRSLTNLNYFPFLLIGLSLRIGSYPPIWWYCSRWDARLSSPIIPLPLAPLVIITMWRLVERKTWPLVEIRPRLGLRLLHLEFLKTFGCLFVEDSTASRA